MLNRSVYLLIVALYLLGGCQAEEASKKPNILVILADDMGYSDLGCYGGEIQTPNLDRLAANGLRFTQFYNAARCCPTRASLLTGLYPHQAGVGSMVYNNNGGGYQGYLNRESVTLAEALKTAGYQTLMSGKWHVGHAKGQWPTDRGFDHFYGINIHVDSYFKVLENCEVYLDGEEVIPATADPVNDLHPEKEWYTTDVFTDHALKFLNEADQEKPFFMYLAYNAPHFPLEAPDEDIAKYQGKYLKGWDKMREEKILRMKELGILPADEVLSPSGNSTWDTIALEDQKELDFRRAIYAAQIDRMDQNIGRVIQQLENSGQLDNTLILFLSDNGCSAETGMYGMNWGKYRMDNYQEWRKESGWSISQGQAWANLSNTPYRMYKKFTFEGGTSTPLIVHWPAAIPEKGALRRNVGHIIDIMPTLCEVAGVEYPDTYEGHQIQSNPGKSLLPLFTGTERGGHEAIFWEHQGSKAVRQDPWKLVALHQGEWELYNIEDDRIESNNLVEKYPEVADGLKALYEQWARDVDVRDWPLDKKD